MSRLQKIRQPLNMQDVSRSSTTSSLDPALSTLSPQDAEVLDAIIAKAPDATAFMTIFKAYSEVLRQRGLDPGNDVVYYKQLLKLGVIKGANWGTKWSIVKDQLGLDVPKVTTQSPDGRVLPAKLTTGLPRSQHEEDVFTLHSHADDTETAVDPLHRPILPLSRPFQIESSSSSKVDTKTPLDLSSEFAMSLTTPRRSFPIRQLFAFPPRPAPASPSATSDIVEEPVRSSTPPLPRFRRNQTHPPAPPFTSMTGNSHEQRTGRINEADAWRKIEQARQLEDATRIRRESLLSMCFRTWLEGLEWIRTTQSQIDDARNHIQLQKYFSRWRMRAVGRRQIAERAAEVARLKIMRALLNFWKEQAHRRRIFGWREEMRSKMIYFRQKGEEKTRFDAWTKWRHMCLSQQLYKRNTLLKAFRRWISKLGEVDHLETIADGFEDTQAHRKLENAMQMWTRRVQMRDAEKYLVDKVSHRIMVAAFETWIRILQDNHCADVHQTKRLLTGVFAAWRRAKAHICVLDSRGDKYLKRRDDLLLRAIIRVWVARERGHLLDRVQSARLTKDAFLVWRRRFQEQKLLEERAVSYSKYASRLLLASVFDAWARRRSLFQSNLQLVEQRYAAGLLSRTLLVWRLRLRAALKRARKASMARKYFLERGVWDKWRLVLEKKKRHRRVQELDRERLRRVFSKWLDTIRRRKQQEQLIKKFQKRTCRRLLVTIVQHWTNRVVFIKLRQIDTTEQHDREIAGVVFTKWRDKCLRHVENLSLVNSFQDVKREDTLRRMFIKWLAAARKSKSRRMRLAEREDELRLEILAAAWEAWRDRFRENRLRDLEYRAIIQNQSSLLYRVFATWYSRSKSVPGIRLYATHLKTKSWDRWRAAMPLAVQARKARETDAKRVLSNMFERWKEAQRLKIALKAVARARYLRLPSPGYKPPASGQQPPDTLHLRPLLHRPLRSQISGTTEAASRNDKGPTPTEPAPAVRIREISSRLGSRPGTLRVRAATTEHPSPRTEVLANTDGMRDRLWNELRGARLYGLTGDRAKSR
ncbi:Sfi1 spindle body protein-domain-containing protein [Gautieria morchelliformis]|nr:Sfi1 spindle body protein-domain-containing protein [Gautieria morchelliformis]